jgi:exoribonuclease-2
MVNDLLRLNSLVLYKKRPARLVHVTEQGEQVRLEIELEDGNRARVRPKDVILLHPGPLHSLGELQPLEGEIELAWEILREDPGSLHPLAELAELIYGEFTPASAWAAWGYVEDSLYFRGNVEAITACSLVEVERQRATRQARADDTQAWVAFLERARAGKIIAEVDARYLREVEDLAYGRRKDSRLLRELGRGERPENAHALLLELGYWDQSIDTYPVRLGLPVTPPTTPLLPLPDEPRLDLTRLAAFAIDDRGNKDPDDALSLEACRLDAEGRLVSARLWVHIADPAALAPAGSPADLEARARGATLYLPEGAVPMLPPAAVEVLGLGLQEVSPALSFGLEVDAGGEISMLGLKPSWVRVQRLSYEQAEERIDELPFSELRQAGLAYQARRKANGAVMIDLPEVILHVVDGKVVIRPLQRLRSRDLVREAMLMAGEAAARFAIENGIPFPFAVQAPPDTPILLREDADAFDDLAEHYAARRSLKRGQVSSHPAPHAGVGLPCYSRATSPLRRYLDLVAHQQLRAFLRGQPLLNEQEMLERVGSSESVTGSVTQAETLARRHWTLVYLLQNPGWVGEAVLVDKVGLRGRVIFPELALETTVHLSSDFPLNTRLSLTLRGVNLPELESHFS